MASDQWDFSEDELKAAMDLEKQAFGTGVGAEKPIETAKRLFEENAADAAMAIIKICKHGSTDRIRFDAAKYITERALGPVAKDAAPALDDELMKFYKTISGVSNE
jgi:hypothetical protein